MGGGVSMDVAYTADDIHILVMKIKIAIPL